MKLLLDENVSFRVLGYLPANFLGSCSLKQIRLKGADDAEIWDYARKNDFAIVTHDTDFNALTLLKGFPPKIIWLRVRNWSAEDIGYLLAREAVQIERFLKDTENGILQIF